MENVDILRELHNWWYKDSFRYIYQACIWQHDDRPYLWKGSQKCTWNIEIVRNGGMPVVIWNDKHLLKFNNH